MRSRRARRLFRLFAARRRIPMCGSMATTIRWMRRASRARSSCSAEIDAYVRDKDPRVRQVTVSLGATWQVVEILRPDGESYRDIRPLVRVNVSVVAGQGDRQESGSKGYGGREGYARFIETKAWRDAADGALREALVNLELVPAPPANGRRAGRRLARRDAA